MEATYKTKSGNLMFKVTGEAVKDIFAQISTIDDVFSNTKCGACGSIDTKFITRTVDENDYYEIRCNNIGCRATLQFGQHKKGGGLFPKRKDGDKNWLPNGGWVIYTPQSRAVSGSGQVSGKPTAAGVTDDDVAF